MVLWKSSVLALVLAVFLVSALLAAGGCGEASHKKNLEKLALKFDKDLADVRQQCERLSEKLAGMLSSEARKTPVVTPEEGLFRAHEEVTFYKTRDDGLGGVWASGFKPVDAEVREHIYRSQAIMADIRGLVENSPGVVQAYYMSSDHFGAFYPYINAVAYFEPLTNFAEAYLPFRMAQPESNPKRLSRWVPPYVDAAGKGYVTTISVPVYVDGEFAGAIGADINIVGFGQDLLAPERAMLLMNKQGLPLAMTKACVKLLGIPMLEEPHYFSGGIKDSHISEGLLLGNSPSMFARELVQAVGKRQDAKLTTPLDTYRIIWVPVPEVEWYLVELVNVDD